MGFQSMTSSSREILSNFLEQTTARKLKRQLNSTTRALTPRCRSLPEELSENVKAQVDDGQVDVGRLDELQVDLDEADLVGLDEMVAVLLQIRAQTVRPVHDAGPQLVEQDGLEQVVLDLGQLVIGVTYHLVLVGQVNEKLVRIDQIAPGHFGLGLRACGGREREEQSTNCLTSTSLTHADSYLVIVQLFYSVSYC